MQLKEGGLELPAFGSLFPRVGYHAVYEKSIREAIDLAIEHGFSSVQIETAMPQFFPERCDPQTRREIGDYAEDGNVTLKVHAPGEDFSLQTLHSSVQRAVLERLKEVIDFACDLGAKMVTVHSGIVPVFTVPAKGGVPINVQYPALCAQRLKTALAELADYSEGRILLCVENSPLSATLMNLLPEMLEDGKLSLAWDLAKMYKADRTVDAEVESFFMEHLGKVRECHLHDRTRKHGHQIIGEGFVDFKRYLSLLSDYDVEYTIEVRPIENAVKSLEALRKIIGQ